jgi:hypothetical protein
VLALQWHLTEGDIRQIERCVLVFLFWHRVAEGHIDFVHLDGFSGGISSYDAKTAASGFKHVPGRAG